MFSDWDIPACLNSDWTDSIWCVMCASRTINRCRQLVAMAVRVFSLYRETKEEDESHSSSENHMNSNSNRFMNRTRLRKPNVSCLYVARSNIPWRHTNITVCDIMRLADKWDDREVLNERFSANCDDNKNPNLLSIILFLVSPSHLTPESVSCINKTCRQIAKGAVTEWPGSDMESLVLQGPACLPIRYFRYQLYLYKYIL